MPKTLDQCQTPKQIESFFQAELKKDRFGNHYQLRQQCNRRAIEIAGQTRRGKLLAIRLDKGQGRSRRYAVGGEHYHTGTWGNGAGFRWGMAGFRSWYEKLLRKSGLRSQRKIELIISWAEDDYLWRSLKFLAA